MNKLTKNELQNRIDEYCGVREFEILEELNGINTPVLVNDLILNESYKIRPERFLKQIRLNKPLSHGLDPRKKFTYDRNYFNKIDSHAKAYFLGFILADGNIFNNRLNNNSKSESVGLRIRISKNDIEVLENLNKEMKSTKPITVVKNYWNGTFNSDKNSEILKLEFNSIELYNDLIDKNILPNKTCKEKPYYDISDEFLNSYILGYFDGDGSIYKGERLCEWSVNSSKEFVLFIKEHLESKLDIKFQAISEDHRTKASENDNHLFRLRTSSKANIRKIREYLYKDSKIYLKRKYEKIFDV